MESVEIGRNIRTEVSALLVGDTLSQALGWISAQSESCAIIRHCMPWASFVLADLQADKNWQEEFWILDEEDIARIATQAQFNSTAEQNRFSRNLCLRRPRDTSYSLRGFLSAFVSDTTRRHLSEVYGRPVKFKSADIASYRYGDYLRRHQDVFDGREFGLVCFFSEEWVPGSGGELVVEARDGRSTAVPPISGTIALMKFDQDNYHQVCQVTETAFRRFSVAIHFSRAE